MTSSTTRSPSGSAPARPPAAIGWRGAADRTAHRVPVLLVLLALPLVRPNLLGESASFVGFGALALAAALTIASRPAQEGRAAGWTGTRPAMVLVGLLALGYLWVLARGAATDPTELGRDTVQGLVLTVGAVLAVVVVCADPRARLAVGRVFVGVVALLCASYVVTALVWTVAGIGSGAVASIPVGATPEPQPVYFPVTPTLGTQGILGTAFPRFTGLGREPGWMAMYCAAAYFMADMVGWRSRWLKLVVVAGLIGCVSTAGFGVFVVAWTYHSFLRDRGTGITIGGYLRHLLGIAALVGAVWLAVAAPVLGLAAKSTQNAISLDERQVATELGLEALTSSPLGGQSNVAQAGINLISDIAVSGLPFVLLVAAALLVPLCLHDGRARYSSAAVLAVFLTMLLSQPAKDSTWAFAVAALAISLRQPDMEPLVPTPARRPAATTTGGRS